MTPFEQYLVDYREGRKALPSVHYHGKNVDPMLYQLAVAKYELGIYASGMLPTRGWKVTPYKNFFGLKGRDRKSLVTQLDAILERYKAELVDIGE